MTLVPQIIRRAKVINQKDKTFVIGTNDRYLLYSRQKYNNDLSSSTLFLLSLTYLVYTNYLRLPLERFMSWLFTQNLPYRVRCLLPSLAREKTQKWTNYFKKVFVFDQVPINCSWFMGQRNAIEGNLSLKASPNE